LFLVRSAAVLVALVGILMMLDLLGKTGQILGHPGNGDAELWRYVGLRLPPARLPLPCPSRSCSAR